MLRPTLHRACAHAAGSAGGISPPLRSRARDRLAWAPRRGFATAVFTVPANGRAREQSLFVVGLNEGKFFGQDGAEEGLKLLERIAGHNQSYELLLGMTDKELKEIEKEHTVKDKRLTPSRDLEGKRNCEFIPLIQAATVDKCKRRPVGRSKKATQVHTAAALFQNYGECVKLYWLFWRRKEHRDAAQWRFWSRQLPRSSRVYFDEWAELVAIRATEQLAALRAKGQGDVVVLAVKSNFYGCVVEELGRLLNQDAKQLLNTPEFSHRLRIRAAELSRDMIDVSALLVFIYLGLPWLALHGSYLLLDNLLARHRVGEQVFGAPEQRD